ncbi:kinase-like protein [Karstenula rhodostoma CBS 690.94]|uniref:Kinase-like protein n=1 Tax=Karstenula rhodostoma CBS 690.94 TaxID=1392251 RepID=A0A9P4PT61_9PLEO|nr:kinase-like protein [Karstenula rhodostoma CBS 690.94]
MSSFTDDHIISLCHDPTTIILSSPQCSNKVARISNDVAVKFGQFVTVQEFKNQQIAQQRLNSDIVTVPRAYRFIQNEDVGYIVMDYAAGKTLDLDSAKEVVKELGKVLNHIHQHVGTKPGSLGGGPVSGELWPEHEEVDFSEPDDLHLWLNRSRSPGNQIDLRNHNLCMCHLDFNPRNIIVDGNRIHLIDWSAAGFFPRFFDHISYQFLPQDLGFFYLLRPFLDPLSNAEEERAQAVVKILRHHQFHVFPGAKIPPRASIGA